MRSLQESHTQTFLTSKLMDTPGLATVDSHITMKTIKAND